MESQRINDRIVVLIPCFNEEKTIAKVVTEFKEYIPEATVFVYDNNSTDKTAQIAEEAGAIVRHEYRQGKGNVIRRMFREIDADVYLMVDGDDTYPAEAARQMCDMVLQQKADMVIGDRLSSTYYEENKRIFHNFGNNLVRNSINHLFHSDIRDIMTGYRAFSRMFAKTFPVLSDGFEIETEMTIHAVDKRMQVKNIIVEYRDRPDGSESKLNTYTDGVKVLSTILKLYKNYRPLQFFTLLSTILICIAAIMFAPVFLTYLETSLVPKIPTLIVSGFIAMAALLSFFAGLILDSIAIKSKQDFELHCLMLESKKGENHG